MPDYKNGKIYKILNTIDDSIYIGSTTELLCQRMGKHKYDCKCERNSKRPLYQKMIQFGLDNFYIELVEMYPCNSKEELLAKEGEWIRNIGSLNYHISGRTRAVYWMDKKQEINEKRNTIVKCECGCEVTDGNMQRHRMSERHIQRMNQTKTKPILETINCSICNKIVTKAHIARHMRTKKCQDIIEAMENKKRNNDGDTESTTTGGSSD